jgi:hypothetical protein
MSKIVSILSLAAQVLWLAGCPGSPATQPGSPDASDHDDQASRVPLPTAYLHRKWRPFGGLMSRLDERGQPIRSGPGADPLVLEARRFYDTVGASLPGATAPMSLDLWKETFGFPLWRRDEGEPLDEYRRRIGAVVYYNKHELGLGRELACRTFPDGVDAAGVVQEGVACFVTNYGAAFSDAHNSLRAAAAGVAPKNTVCITHRPSQPVDYRVQFYAYGPAGERLEWAELDTQGPRPLPHVCMNCHGGSYDETKHLAKDARFLPIDPSLVVFAASPPQLTREAQEEALRVINMLSLSTPLAPAQVESVRGLYAGQIEQEGARAVDDFVLPGWAATPTTRDTYLQVIKPLCGTCHFADARTDGRVPWYYPMFLDADELARATLALGSVCGTFEMPNAQPTLRYLWRPREGGVRIGERVYEAPIDALLAMWSIEGRDCGRALEVVGDCRLASPAACGNAWSGVGCQPNTGACVPDLHGAPPLDARAPTGVCRLAASPSCSRGQECRPSQVVPGFDGACFTCGREDQPVCTQRAAPCDDDLLPIDEMCRRAP